MTAADDRVMADGKRRDPDLVSGLSVLISLHLSIWRVHPAGSAWQCDHLEGSSSGGSGSGARFNKEESLQAHDTIEDGYFTQAWQGRVLLL